MIYRDYHWQTHLFSKQGKIVAALAQEFLQYAPQDRARSIQAYSQKFNASVGTVQSAINYLQEQGAVELQSRGRLGAFLRGIDYGKLWALAYHRPMIGALPLPFSRRIEGLATALRQSFHQQPFNLELRFMRGANTRLQALTTQHCDWTVVSRYVAETAFAHGFDIETVLLLGPNTYTVDHVLLTRDVGADSLRDGMRVGIDMNSTDHAYVARTISRGKQVKFVEIDYSQALELLSADIIDATVWTKADLPATMKDIRCIELDEAEDENFRLLGEAAIVTRPENRAVNHLLRALLDVDSLRDIQQRVAEHAQLPMY